VRGVRALERWWGSASGARGDRLRRARRRGACSRSTPRRARALAFLEAFELVERTEPPQDDRPSRSPARSSVRAARRTSDTEQLRGRAAKRVDKLGKGSRGSSEARQRGFVARADPESSPPVSAPLAA
jgi:hypothetical protein